MAEKQKAWKSQAILFLVSQCITLFGSTLVQMTIVWYVTILTSSGAWVAAFTVCSYLPQFLISFFVGAWADRYSRKKLIIGADSLAYLDEECLYEMSKGLGICTGCFNGKYPLDPPTEDIRGDYQK